jgi:hypothetical protein
MLAPIIAREGIAATIVNGTLAFDNRQTTGDFAGRVLKGRQEAG